MHPNIIGLSARMARFRDSRSRRTALALADGWGIDAPLRPLGVGSTARVWATGDQSGVVVKLAPDERRRLETGLRAAATIEGAGHRRPMRLTTRESERVRRSTPHASTFRDRQAHWGNYEQHP